MKRVQSGSNATLADKLVIAATSAATYNKSLQAPPVSVLWPDAEGQWLPVIGKLRTMTTNLFSLGTYEPEAASGPAIWLKTMIAGIDDFSSSSSRAILYLPGVGRADLRAIEGCPRELQPLAELQYRGVFWSQTNGKDWTINAFLTSKNGGLGLDVSQDQETQKALLRAVSSGVLLDVKVADLEGRLINAAWLNNLLAPNATRDILAWLNQPAKAKTDWEGGHWEIFADRCRKDFGFDPVKDGVLIAAEKLATRAGSWSGVWQLYEDSWSSFPKVVELLEKVSPPAATGLFDDFSGYPKANLEAEIQLRASLEKLGSQSPVAARQAILEYEKKHAERQNSLWANMGRAPLVMALGHLSVVAELSKQLPVGTVPNAQAESYTTSLWRIDSAAMKAWASVHTKADTDAVSQALTAIYVPWLDESASRFQHAVKDQGSLNSGASKSIIQPDGVCTVFVDGLRYDVAVDLKTRLDAMGKVVLSSRWTAIPSVTASGKAWASPVADKIAGTPTDLDFEPSVAGTDKPLNTHNFRKLLVDAGIQVLSANELGDASGRAWVECGDLDHFGHAHELRLARDLDNQLNQIVERLQELSDSGWRHFQIVTDHGWLLVPGGLPKTELSKFQAETRWGRCAVLKNSATASALTFGWDWNPQVQIAFAPGISSFIAGSEYAHGGLSLQECLVPVLDVVIESGPASAVNVAITKVSWRGMRCQVEVLPTLLGLRADIRTKAAAADTSVLNAPKPLDGGKASLAVPDDGLEGSAVVVVILDQDGNVIQKANTTVGE